MKVKIEKGNIQLDVGDLVDAMSTEDKRRVARSLCADEYLIKAVLEIVGSPDRFGNYFSDDEDGQWWFSPRTALEMREKLLPMLPEVARQAVIEALHQRDQANAEMERHSRWAWRMYHAWPDGYARARPELEKFEPLPAPRPDQTTGGSDE